jgi:hypothetical protein
MNFPEPYDPSLMPSVTERQLHLQNEKETASSPEEISVDFRQS